MVRLGEEEEGRVFDPGVVGQDGSTVLEEGEEELIHWGRYMDIRAAGKKQGKLSLATHVFLCKIESKCSYTKNR